MRARARSLTPRQAEILALFASGKRSPEIARDLWISEETVKSHADAIRFVLRARSIAQAVAIAIRRGLID
jgi:DNA-binding CsgD family transcriptional regulator